MPQSNNTGDLLETAYNFSVTKISWVFAGVCIMLPGGWPLVTNKLLSSGLAGSMCLPIENMLIYLNQLPKGKV